MARDKVVYVPVEWVIPLQFVDGDDVVNGWRLRMRPLKGEVDELAALVANLACGKHSRL
jgi:hypothetical protein